MTQYVEPDPCPVTGKQCLYNRFGNTEYCDLHKSKTEALTTCDLDSRKG